MPNKTTIVVHHFASHWGNLKHCRDWHVNGNGWRDVGYHWIINNGYPDYADYAKQKRRADWDGKVEQARKPETSTAAGVSPQQHPTRNRDGVHISLVGNFDTYTPTKNQMDAAIKLCVEICERHGISPDNIYYHEDFANKSCPGKKFIARSKFRQMVKDAQKGKKSIERLFVNGKQVKGAYLVGSSWYCPEGSLSEILGGTTQTPSMIAPVGALLKRWGWTNQKYTPNPEQNRADMRAVKVP